MSEEALRDPSFWTVLLDATERTQAPFIRRVLDSRFWRRYWRTTRMRWVRWPTSCGARPAPTLQGTDRQTATSALRDVATCLGEAATDPSSTESSRSSRRTCNINRTNGTFYWERASGTLYSNNDAWHDFIKSKVKALDIDFDDIDRSVVSGSRSFFSTTATSSPATLIASTSAR